MAKDKCSKCGKKLGLFNGKKIIRCKPYCRGCSMSIPTCDKCKWHFRSDLYDYGVCHYHQQWLQDYDNICTAYEKGPQVHPDELRKTRLTGCPFNGPAAGSAASVRERDYYMAPAAAKFKVI